MSDIVDPLATSQRTHLCGALRAGHDGEAVALGGWVHRSRDLGGIVFLDLRDRAGLVQVSFDPRFATPEVIVAAQAAGLESAVLIEGTVALRPVEMQNGDMPTGAVEVKASSIRVVGPAVTPAIPVARGKGAQLPAEELRLKHRLLDLRRPELQANLMLRHRLLQRTRASMAGMGFFEIETPILTKPTPEGARDFLVPSRVHAGEFYALPQSPQIYKQMLMVAGFDRYFQVARCFRDEDLRADRQLEFTQIDLEMSFVDQRDVQRVVEQVLVDLWAEAGKSVSAPFLRMKWHDAMEAYGVDKPDLRYASIKISDLTGLVGDDAAPFVREAITAGGRVRALRLAHAADVTRKELDAMAAAAKDGKAGGLIWARRTAAGWEGQGVKAIGASALERLGGDEGDLLLAVSGPDQVTSPALHNVRMLAVKRPGAEVEAKDAFCWIVDFPLFEPDAETGARVFAHHPFTAPHPEDRDFLESEPDRCRALHYDAVYNGNELGSGSIRIIDPVLQSTVFRLLGINEADQQKRFGFMLDGLAAGAPPHGGFALGFDRIAMLLAGAPSLRDVIAFPKTTAARALFEGAPTALSAADIRPLHIAPIAD